MRPASPTNVSRPSEQPGISGHCGVEIRHGNSGEEHVDICHVILLDTALLSLLSGDGETTRDSSHEAIPVTRAHRLMERENETGMSAQHRKADTPPAAPQAGPGAS